MFESSSPLKVSSRTQTILKKQSKKMTNLIYRDGSYYYQTATSETKLNQIRISTWGVEDGNDLVILTTLDHEQIVDVLSPIIEEAKEDASSLSEMVTSLESEMETRLPSERFFYDNIINNAKRLMKAKQSGAFYNQESAVESLKTAYPNEITEMGCIEDFSNY